MVRRPKRCLQTGAVSAPCHECGKRPSDAMHVDTVTTMFYCGVCCPICSSDGGTDRTTSGDSLGSGEAGDGGAGSRVGEDAGIRQSGGNKVVKISLKQERRATFDD